MHYTSIENIHKVIDPLFLNDLTSELNDILKIAVPRTRKNKLAEYQKQLASLTFLDPACGSGNFLTETYLSLRRLENRAIQAMYAGQMSFGEAINPIQVSITQFHGIEINDFAVTVAKTALWIAECQTMQETEDILYMHLDFLPLKTNANIIEGNALNINWEKTVPKNELNYIMGNPPFVGNVQLSQSQKNDLDVLFNGKEGRLDYVSAWYVKTVEYIQNTHIRAAFVSTNSITQGIQVPTLWGFLKDKYHFHLDFAYQTFVWSSEALNKAAVHCVIIGFSYDDVYPKILFSKDSQKEVTGISFYMTEGSDFIVYPRNAPLEDIPKMVRGNQPSEVGWLVLSKQEKEDILIHEPAAEKYIKQFMMGKEFINGIERYCLWLEDISAKELNALPMVKARVEKCKEARLKAPAKLTQSFAATPTLFGQRAAKFDGNYIALGRVSSQNRRYVPMNFLTQDVIAGDKLYIIPNGTIYMFGILMSNIHNSWMRMFAGRMKSDYSYSTQMVYNTFPWPSPSNEQRVRIEQTAQGILNARKIHPDWSLADMYNPLTMPIELQKAHIANDVAVMKAYGFDVKSMSETDCVAALMKMYQEKISEINATTHK